MANDITTLAIEIQSQEAERNLRTFQELLTLSSQTAHKMEKVSIEIDAGNAISQLQTMRGVLPLKKTQIPHFDYVAYETHDRTLRVTRDSVAVSRLYGQGSVRYFQMGMI